MAEIPDKDVEEAYSSECYEPSSSVSVSRSRPESNFKLIDGNVLNQLTETSAIMFFESNDLDIDDAIQLLRACVDTKSLLTAEIFFYLRIKNGKRIQNLEQLISHSPDAITEDVWAPFRSLLIENEITFIKENKRTEEEVMRILDHFDLSVAEADQFMRSCVLVNRDLALKAYSRLRVNFDNKINNIEVFISQSQLILKSTILKHIRDVIRSIKEKTIDYGMGDDYKLDNVRYLEAHCAGMQYDIDGKKERLNDIVQSGVEVSKDVENIDIRYANIQNEIEYANEEQRIKIQDLNDKIATMNDNVQKLKLVDVEIANLREEIHSRKQEINEKYNIIDTKRKNYFKLKNYNDNDQREEDNEKSHIFISIIICFGAMVIGGTMIGTSPFVNEDIYSPSNLAYYVVPFFTAALGTFMTFFSKENKLLFFNEKRLLLSIVHVLFIAVSTSMYFASHSKGLVIALRSLQGIFVGLMSYILPILIHQVAGDDKFRIYLIVFFAFFSVGVAVFKAIGIHWIRFISLIPGIQTIFIWAAHKEIFEPIDLTFKKEFILLDETDEKRNLLLLFMHIFTYQAFISPLAFWVGIMKYNNDFVHLISLAGTFLVSSLIFAIVSYFARDFENGTIRNTMIFGSVAGIFSLAGFICLLCGKILVGFYVIAFASGAGLNFIAFIEFCKMYQPAAIKTAFVLYWILNGFSAILYAKTSILVWSIVGIVSIGIPLIFGIIDFISSDISVFSVEPESIYAKMAIIALGGITIGGSLVGRPLQVDYGMNTWFSVCFQSLPFFTAFLGAIFFIIFGFFFKSTDLRIWLTVINVLFIIFDVIMSTVRNHPTIIVFRSFQGILLGILSMLIPAFIRNLKEFKKLFYAVFIFCVSLGMFSHMMFSTYHLKYISIIPALQVFFTWYLNKPNCEIYIEESLDISPEYAITPVIAFVQAFFGNVAFLIYLTYSHNPKLYAVTYISGALLIGFVGIPFLYFFNYFSFTAMIVVGVIITLSGHVSAYLEQFPASFYVIAFGIGMFSMIPCTHEASYKSNLLYFLSFWLFNGFATVMYMKVSVHYWSIVGLSFISASVILTSLGFYYYYLLDHKVDDSNCVGIHFIEIVLCIGAFTVSGFMTAAPLDEHDRFLEQLLPFFIAAVPAVIVAVLRLCCEVTLVPDSRILLTVANILFIVFQIIIIQTVEHRVVRIVFRCLQGLVVGYLSFILPMLLIKVSECYFPAYIISFALGIVLSKLLNSFWFYISFIFPSLQIILIWIGESDLFEIDFDDWEDVIFDSFPVFISQIPQAFLGSLAFWMIPYDKEWHSPLLLLTFILPVIASTIIYYFLYNGFELYSLFSSILPLIFFFAAFFVAGNQSSYFITAFAIGAFTFSMPWTIFYSKNSESCCILTWGSFWILNGFAYLMYSYIGLTFFYVNLGFACLAILVCITYGYHRLHNWIQDELSEKSYDRYCLFILSLGGIFIGSILSSDRVLFDNSKIANHIKYFAMAGGGVLSYGALLFSPDEIPGIITFINIAMIICSLVTFFVRDLISYSLKCIFAGISLVLISHCIQSLKGNILLHYGMLMMFIVFGIMIGTLAFQPNLLLEVIIPVIQMCHLWEDSHKWEYWFEYDFLIGAGSHLYFVFSGNLGQLDESPFPLDLINSGLMLFGCALFEIFVKCCPNCCEDVRIPMLILTMIIHMIGSILTFLGIIFCFPLVFFSLGFFTIQIQFFSEDHDDEIDPSLFWFLFWLIEGIGAEVSYATSISIWSIISMSMIGLIILMSIWAAWMACRD